MDTWPAIEKERASLVGALAELPNEAWDKPSLCTGWRVRDVVGHLIATAKTTPPRFFGKLAGNGFSFQKMTMAEIRRVTEGRSNLDLVADFGTLVSARHAPPGPAVTWLGETIVHGEDIFRALGPYREHEMANLVTVADFYSGSNLLIGSKNRIAGVSLRATDTEWRHGSGPEVFGPMIALVLAMTGRRAALDDVTGEGVEELRRR